MPCESSVANVRNSNLTPEGFPRQNVVFEHGYLIAKLGRERVVPLVSGRVELPSDISGIVYVDDTNWQIEIAKEMKSVGYSVDFNKIIGS